MRRVAVLVMLFGLFAVNGYALEISSVYPEVAVIETPVTLIGGPFTAKMRVLLGEELIEPRLLSPRQLVFVVPAIEPGVYALSLVDEMRHSEEVLKLQVVFPPPEIVALEPETLDECYDLSQHEVVLRGRYLRPDSNVMLNNLALPSKPVNDTEMTFEAPKLSAGIYGVQVVNPDGSASLPHSLEFSNSPEIMDVTVGEDFVNTYQLVITGKNFFYRSIVVVSEYPTGFSDLPPTQHSLVARRPPAQVLNNPEALRETLYYQDCNTLIYNRYPLSGESRRVILRISNPDGKQSEAFEISTP